LQFCLAHLIRDVKFFFLTLPDERDRRYGEELRAALKWLFDVFHHRGDLDDEQFRSYLSFAKSEAMRVCLSGPATKHDQKMKIKLPQVAWRVLGPINGLGNAIIRSVGVVD
jgi:hypothetical protein